MKNIKIFMLLFCLLCLIQKSSAHDFIVLHAKQAKYIPNPVLGTPYDVGGKYFALMKTGTGTVAFGVSGTTYYQVVASSTTQYLWLYDAATNLLYRLKAL